MIKRVNILENHQRAVYGVRRRRGNIEDHFGAASQKGILLIKLRRVLP